jgi:hypothetical protein
MFGWVFTKVLGFLSGGVIEQVAGVLNKRADTQALTHGQDTVAATQIVASQMQAEIEARKEQRAFSSEHGWIVTFFAIPIIAHVWAIVLDSIFHLNWAIAKLPAPFDEYEGKIILAFFVVVPAASVVQRIVGTIWK